MEIKYEDSLSIHLGLQSFSFYEDELTEEIGMPQVHKNENKPLSCKG